MDEGNQLGRINLHFAKKTIILKRLPGIIAPSGICEPSYPAKLLFAWLPRSQHGCMEHLAYDRKYITLALTCAQNHVQIFILLEVGEKMAAQSPQVLAMLPEEITAGRLELIALACVREARACFSAFCAKISHDASKHTGISPQPLVCEIEEQLAFRQILTHSSRNQNMQ